MKIMAKDSPVDGKPSKKVTSSLPLFYRWILVILILLLVSGYIIALITGTIKNADKIDAVTLGLIALAALSIVALINPHVLQRIRIFEVGSLRVELQAVQAAQSEQQDALDGIRLVLGILLPEKEQNHLVNLLNDTGRNYTGGWSMRTDLNHLLSLGMIEMRGDHDVEREMRSNIVFDLGDFVKLTDPGKKSAKLINEAREAKEKGETSD
jgi:p-aminobenzoyl-glutamate transporter AbgT